MEEFGLFYFHGCFAFVLRHFKVVRGLGVDSHEQFGKDILVYLKLCLKLSLSLIKLIFEQRHFEIFDVHTKFHDGLINQ